MTYRQFLAWQAWLRHDMGEPDRHDHYAMQIACELARMFAKNPERIELKNFRIRFKEERPLTQEEAVAHSKRVWGAVTGIPVTPAPGEVSL